MTYIQVKFQLDGIHHYPLASGKYALLSNPHRHVFHFRVRVSVNHSDREIEFLAFKDELINYISTFSPFQSNVSTMSCEQLAEGIISYIKGSYPGRAIECEVSEDDENSAIITVIEV